MIGIGDLHNAVHVTGHDDKCIQRHIIADGFGILPLVAGNPTPFILCYFPAADLPEQGARLWAQIATKYNPGDE